ncbi:hypothetical protein MATL_G00150220 [Megalops atlanticus]|uniref:NTF2 domain-containing protein n=1 Tax=Megalops atlanticus TaxID=7932 RepID=A0A9D3PUS9_MEGAT|nr:hypothetical protein MATL_G00150220 [Megalops atlanticus]
MSGLTKKEREGCIRILKRLSHADLFALSDTVTNRMIVVENMKEAMEAILTYTQSAEELLKRKKVHRDIIFKYLADEGEIMPPTAEKNQLVKRALQFWSSAKTVPAQTNDKKEDISSAGEGISDYQALGQQFCQWFFQLLNTQNPTLGQPALDWGPQHFWEDARLTLCSCTEQQQQKEDFQGAQVVSLRLLALVRDERIFFCPNLEPHGLKCITSPHGLVVVAVAGTIHRERACLGIFEQVFGLIRSPLDSHSWKIKFAHLKIRGQNALAGGEDVTAPALTYDSGDLQLFCE